MNVDTILERYPKIVESFRSLGQVKEKTKYYCDPNDKKFYVRGGSVAVIAEGLFGQWGKWGAEVGSGLMGESHDKLAEGITELKKDADHLVTGILSVASQTWMTPTSRKPLIEIMTEIYSAVIFAKSGIERLESTYVTELDKSRRFGLLVRDYKDFCDRIYKFTEELRKQNMIDEANEECEIRHKEGRRFIDEEFRRRSLSDMTMYHTAKDRRGMTQTSRHLLPDELSSQIMADFYYYLKVNTHKLNTIIEKQLQVSRKHNFVMLRKEESHLFRTIQYYKDKSLIFLKEESGIPDVRKVLRFEDRKILMVIQRKLIDDKVIHRVENDIEYLEKHSGARGFVVFKGASRYFSKDPTTLTHSVLIRNYDLGSLDNCVKRGDLTFKEKCLIALDILHALKALHKDKVVHLNLRPSTILIEKKSLAARKAGISAGVMGFEFAKPVSPGDAKETPDTDMWMLGHVLHYLFTGNQTTWIECMQNHTIMDADPCIAMGKKIQFDEPKLGTVEHLIWQLLLPSGYERPSAAKAIEEIESVLEFEKMKEDLETAIVGLSEIQALGE